MVTCNEALCSCCHGYCAAMVSLLLGAAARALLPERTEKMVYIHGNLRLVDKLQGMDYAEEQIQWAPEHKEALEQLWGVGGGDPSNSG